MTPDEFRAAIARLGLSQAGTARLFRVDEHTTRRWATGDQDVPRAVQICLKLMIRFRIDPKTFL